MRILSGAILFFLLFYITPGTEMYDDTHKKNKLDSHKIPGVSLIQNFQSRDRRGEFRKIYCRSQLNEINLFPEMEECFFSLSHKNVIRGMHFQLPPHACAKLVTVITGRVLDVICDLRKNSPTYLQSTFFSLSADIPESLYIPPGCAHGFLSLEDNTLMLYNTTAEYNPFSDSGIHYRSISFNWPIDEKDAVVSDRDKTLLPLVDFDTPFYFNREGSL